MSRLYSIILFSLIVTLSTGCNHKKSSPQPAREIGYSFRGMGPLLEVPDTSTFSEDEPIEYEPWGTIDFFGVKLIGPIEPILSALDTILFIRVDLPSSSILSSIRDDDRVTRYYTTIYIDDIPFGMNVEYRKTDPELVHEVIFITSNDDDYVCHTVVDRLTDYYGYPDINDFVEDTYAWYDMWDFRIRFRHLHTSDGGWTFYMSR